MLKPLRLLTWLCAALVALPLLALAQPAARTLHLVVPYPPGGTVDSLARITAEKLQPLYPGGVVVENKAGANGNIGAEYVYRSQADGLTLLFAPSGPIAINHHLYKKLSYDPTRWVPVAMIADVPNVLLVNPGFPARNLKEFVAHVKANPGKVSFASQGSGSSSHLAAALFMALTETQMIHVPYKGTGPALTDLIGGQVDVFFDNLSSGAKFHENGKLRILALADEKRSQRLPEIPTFAEAGGPALKGMISSAWYAVVAPPGTPKATVEASQKAILGVLSQPEVKRKFAELGIDPDVASPSQTSAYLRSESERWGKVIRDAKVTVD